MGLQSAVATEGMTDTSMEPSTAAHPGGGGSEEGEVVAASAEVEPEEGEVVAASAEVELEDGLEGLEDQGATDGGSARGRRSHPPPRLSKGRPAASRRTPRPAEG